jgi:osmoprotectant transport system permease protein
MIPLALAGIVLGLLVLGMPTLKPLFAWAFPSLDRPLYEGDSFVALTLDHLMLVAASSLIAACVGCAAGILVTRRSGAEFRGLVDALVSIAQTFPPVAVLALTVPVMGFGPEPALVALVLYALLPIVENTIVGLETVPEPVRESARGLGMGSFGMLVRVELPLAAPVILAGIRTAVVVNVGTATVASTVGAKTLGLPIIIGLNGANSAYVIQGALVVACLAVFLDLAFGRLVRRVSRWQAPISG